MHDEIAAYRANRWNEPIGSRLYNRDNFIGIDALALVWNEAGRAVKKEHMMETASIYCPSHLLASSTLDYVVDLARILMMQRRNSYIKGISLD